MGQNRPDAAADDLGYCQSQMLFLPEQNGFSRGLTDDADRFSLDEASLRCPTKAVISFFPCINQAWLKETKIRFTTTVALLAFGFWLASLNDAKGQLLWSDEFDGTSLDTTHWTFDLGTGPPYP